MFCVLLGIVPPLDDEAVERVQNTVIKIQETADVQWSSARSLVDDEETGKCTLLLSAISEEPGTPELILTAVEDALNATYSCEVWASAPARLPLRPITGYPSFEDSNTLREWGLMVRENILDTLQIAELREIVNAAIENVDALLHLHRPNICIGQDTFLFREIGSRGNQRFDLRLTNATDFINKNILPKVSDVLVNILGTDQFDFDVSVVYSRPGANFQGWHADGDHQGKDAGWDDDGWKNCLAEAYAICLFLPLIDLNDETGFTQFWPGSHRNRDLLGFSQVAQITQALFDGKLSAGSGIFYDYRLFHRGMPNCSQVLRPVLQVIFKRRWYVEKANYGTKSIIPNDQDDMFD